MPLSLLLSLLPHNIFKLLALSLWQLCHYIGGQGGYLIQQLLLLRTQVGYCV